MKNGLLIADGVGCRDKAQIRVLSRISRFPPTPAAVKQKERVWEMKLR
jgi:hypothetical protein